MEGSKGLIRRGHERRQMKEAEGVERETHGREEE
jgi:hypothetical protein